MGDTGGADLDLVPLAVVERDRVHACVAAQGVEQARGRVLPARETDDGRVAAHAGRERRGDCELFVARMLAKSTLCRLLLVQEEPDRGTIRFGEAVWFDSERGIDRRAHVLDQLLGDRPCERLEGLGPAPQPHRRIGAHGVGLVPAHTRVLTHCNTGSLAHGTVYLLFIVLNSAS